MRSASFDCAEADHILRVRKLSVGDGPTSHTLVFLHDSLGSIAVWRNFPDRLAERLQLDAIVFDRRGYGESSPFPSGARTPKYLEDEGERLGPMLERLGVDSSILFGHSDGGSIALIAGALWPERVRAIVTEGAHVFVEERTLAGIRDARETLRTTNLREKLLRYHGDKTDSVTSAWIDTWLSPAFRDWNIEAYLPRVLCPSLVIQGADDEYGTRAQLRAITDGVSGYAESLMLPGVQHTPHREAPDAVIEASTRFLVANLGLEGPTVDVAPS